VVRVTITSVVSNLEAVTRKCHDRLIDLKLHAQ
jgi:hypothetical protein